MKHIHIMHGRGGKCITTINFTANLESSPIWFSFDLSPRRRCYKLSGFSCLPVTPALVVQQLQISHHHTREIRGSQPTPSGQIYRASLERGAVASGAEPISFQGEMISVSLARLLL